MPVIIAVLRSWFLKWTLKKGITWAVAALLTVFGDDIARTVVRWIADDDKELAAKASAEIDRQQGRPLEPKPDNDEGLVELRQARDDFRAGKPGAIAPDSTDDFRCDDFSRRMSAADSLDDAYEQLCSIALDRERCERREADYILEHRIRGF